MSRPKVAIMHFSAPPTVGGVEAVIAAHAAEFIKAGYPVTIVAGRGEASALPDGADFLQIPEIDSQNPQILAISAHLAEGQVPDNFVEMEESLKAKLEPPLREFDRVIVHNIFTKHFNLPLTAALHQILDDRPQAGWIAWNHDFSWTSPGSRKKLHPGYPWDLLRRYRPDMRYVTVSQARQKELALLLECPEDVVRVVYNGVDPSTILGLSDRVEAIVETLDLLDHDLIFLMPVRVTHAKNMELALRTVKALKDGSINPVLVVVGPPDPHDEQSMRYFSELKMLRDNLGLNQEFHFLYELVDKDGAPLHISNREVGELYRLADIVFIPSFREGFGIPVLEGGLVGVHVFSTPIPAAVEIGGENVSLFQNDDTPEQVAEQISTWMEQDSAYHLRRRVRREFTWHAIFQHSIEPLLWP